MTFRQMARISLPSHRAGIPATALLPQPYIKGRDLYDLIWYLADRSWPEPNLRFLNNALAQTGWKGPLVTEVNWRRLIENRVKSMDWTEAKRDATPFLERIQEAELITKENVLSLLKTRQGLRP